MSYQPFTVVGSPDDVAAAATARERQPSNGGGVGWLADLLHIVLPIVSHNAEQGEDSSLCSSPLQLTSGLERQTACHCCKQRIFSL